MIPIIERVAGGRALSHPARPFDWGQDLLLCHKLLIRALFRTEGVNLIGPLFESVKLFSSVLFEKRASVSGSSLLSAEENLCQDLLICLCFARKELPCQDDICLCFGKERACVSEPSPPSSVWRELV